MVQDLNVNVCERSWSRSWHYVRVDSLYSGIWFSFLSRTTSSTFFCKPRMEIITGPHQKVRPCPVYHHTASSGYRSEPSICPLGHVDPGEDDLTTAWRETEEEAGLGQEHLRVVDGFLQRLHYQVHGKEKEVLYWLAELRDPNVVVRLSEEHQDYRWVKLEEACRLAKYQDLQDTLKNVQRFLETGEKTSWYLGPDD